MNEILKSIVEKYSNDSETIEVVPEDNQMETIILSYVTQNLSPSSQTVFAENLLKGETLDKSLSTAIFSEQLNILLADYLKCQM